MTKETKNELKRIRNRCYHLIVDLYNKHEKLELNHGLGYDSECVHCQRFHVIQEVIREKEEELLPYNQKASENATMGSGHRVTEKDIGIMQKLHTRRFTNAAIAEHLNISQSTVYQKLSKFNKDG